MILFLKLKFKVLLQNSSSWGTLIHSLKLSYCTSLKVFSFVKNLSHRHFKNNFTFKIPSELIRVIWIKACDYYTVIMVLDPVLSFLRWSWFKKKKKKK